MATAKANYIISAQDATKDAIRSIQANFKSLDQGIQTTARGVNLTLGFLAGAGLKGLFRSSLDATAEVSGATSEFSKTLDDVKKSATALMVPKEGLPGVTANLKELAETLKDPAIQSAADHFFSGLLKDGTALVNVLAQTAAGLRILATGKGGNAQVDLDNQILEQQKLLKGFDSDPRNSVAQAARKEIQHNIDVLQSEIDVYRQIANTDTRPQLDGVASVQGAERAIKSMQDQQDAAEELEKALKELSDTSEKMPWMIGDAVGDMLSKGEDPYKQYEAAQDAIEEQRKLFKEAQKSITEIDNAIVEENKRAARESTEAWGDMFFTAMEDGFDGVLHKWKQTLKMMVAESAASGILSFLKGGSFLGGFNSGLTSAGSSLAHLLGFANGGSILPGGSGSTDSQVVAFRKSPSERVDIYTPGKQGGGVNFTYAPVIDARGATVDLARALPGILDAHGKAVEARVVTGLRNGRYDS